MGRASAQQGPVQRRVVEQGATSFSIHTLHGRGDNGDKGRRSSSCNFEPVHGMQQGRVPVPGTYWNGSPNFDVFSLKKMQIEYLIYVKSG